MRNQKEEIIYKEDNEYCDVLGKIESINYAKEK